MPEQEKKVLYTAHLETAVLLSQLKQKPDDYINVTIELDDMDITSAETKATYDEIKEYVFEHNAGMKVSNLYISQVKRKCGIEVGKNYNLPKNEDSSQPQCPVATGSMENPFLIPQRGSCTRKQER